MIAGFAFYLFATCLLGAGMGVIFSKNPVHSVLFLILSFFNGAALFVLLGAEFLAMLLVIVYVGAVAVLFLFVVMMIEIVPPKTGRLSWEERKARLRKGFKESFRFKLAFIPVFLALVYGIGAADVLIAEGGKSRLLMDGIPLSLWFIWSGESVDLSAVAVSGSLLIFSFFVALHVGRRLSGVSIVESSRHFFAALPMSFFVGALLLFEFAFLAFYWSSSPYYEQVVSLPIPPADLMTNTQALASVIYRYYVYIFQGAGLILLVAMIGSIVLSLKGKTTMKRQDIESQINRQPSESLELTKPGIGEGVHNV